MKIALTYGFGMAIAGSLLTLVMFFLGYHNDVEKLSSGSAQALGLINWVIPIVGVTLAIRAHRAVSEDGSLSYGRGVGVGTLTGLFAGIFSAAFTILYGTVINPGFAATIQEQQRVAMAESGMSEAQIDQAAGVAAMFTSPYVFAALAIFFSVFVALVVALIAAAVFKRAAPGPTIGPPPLSG